MVKYDLLMIHETCLPIFKLKLHQDIINVILCSYIKYAAVKDHYSHGHYNTILFICPSNKNRGIQESCCLSVQIYVQSLTILCHNGLNSYLITLFIARICLSKRIGLSTMSVCLAGCTAGVSFVRFADRMSQIHAPAIIFQRFNIFLQQTKHISVS